MAESQAADDDTPAKLSPSQNVFEGDRVLLAIRWHGEAHAGEYNQEIFRSVVEGVVTDAPSDSSYIREMIRNGDAPMVDYAVETDDGEVYKWNVDNGYIIGHHPELDRRTDVGRFAGFYEA